MIEQDSFSLARESSHHPASTFTEHGDITRQNHSQKSSIESNAALRDLIKPWGALPFTPQSCRTVSFSRWTRFTASSTTSTPTSELKASTLCKASGLAPTYDPPTSEWVYLGADQPVNVVEPRSVLRQFEHRRQRSSASWATVSPASDGGEQSKPIQFRKQEVKPVNISSQLSNSFRTSPGACKQPSTMKMMLQRLGLENATCEELPSPFESDSEGEDN
ncbi:hypothetical protein N0V83_009465 [Neocucurbitaria cava]|uniref:Uncharacterized protein n=1 Tax=Neocucurbitaria cava TaxID=798079 RepID=A0A9W9CII1_9PLEO|nr:hypothetical protein N0V83_009465 [Neocucurbitaria cava]